jgi:hypothetical protein
LEFRRATSCELCRTTMGWSCTTSTLTPSLRRPSSPPSARGTWQLSPIRTCGSISSGRSPSPSTQRGEKGVSRRPGRRLHAPVVLGPGAVVHSCTTTAHLCTGGLVRHYTGGSRNRLWCTACDVKQHHRRSIKNRL